MLKRLGWAVLLFALCVQLSGCPPAIFVAGGAVGAGAMGWVKGKLEEELHVPLSKVHQASLAALEELELPIEEDRKDMLAAAIRSEFADGKRIWIDMHSLSESSTKISIRVGTMGDKTRSKRLLETIHRYLELQ